MVVMVNVLFQSFALPSIKPKPTLPQSLEDGHNTAYGVPEYMTTGLVNSRQDPVGCAHPLAATEGNVSCCDL